MRLARVILRGFKNLDRDHSLGEATLILGANGTGKSAVIQAIRYAITGKVPSGMALDQVARFFPARGGAVEVYDSEGNWIQRGITLDHEKSKVSELLTTSDTKEGEEPNLSRWRVQGAVLDLKEFLGLSANLRREHLLALCGSGSTTDAAELLGELECEYAREIAGDVATPAILASSSTLSAETDALWGSWRSAVSAVVKSHLVGGKTITETCLRLGDVAKEHRLAAGKAAKDAKAAIRELEAEAKGAQAAALEVDSLKILLEERSDDYIRASAKYAHQSEAKKARDRSIEDLTSASKALALAKGVFDSKEDPGAEPIKPEISQERDDVRRDLGDAEGELAFAKAQLADLLNSKEKIDKLTANITAARFDLEKLQKSDLGALSRLMDTCPLPPGHPWLVEMSALVMRLSKSHLEQVNTLQDRVAGLRKEVAMLQDGLSASELASAKAQVLEAAATAVALTGRLDEIIRSQSVVDWSKTHAAWCLLRQERDLALKTLDAVAARHKQATLAADQAWHRIEELGMPDPSPVEAKEVELGLLKTKLATAQKSAGALTAYCAATERAESQKITESAWKAFEAALKRARERLVGSAAAPLMRTLGAVLSGAGRQETAYLELENARGKPIFELGWVRGGERIALEALSDGEAAIFAAALGIAIALSADGIRLLMLEADSLDRHNMKALIGAIIAWAPKLDALIVATCREIPEQAASEWTKIAPPVNLRAGVSAA